jgi:hypothetical protein
MPPRALEDPSPGPGRWPLLLLLAGAVSLLPWPSVIGARALVEDGCLTLRRFVDPRAWSGGAAHAATASGAALPALRDRLARAHARVLPPKESGWQRDGRFAAVPLARARTPSTLSLALPGALPPGEPVFHGRELVGHVAAKAGSAPTGTLDPATTIVAGSAVAKITTIRAKDSRVPACAGIPGKRETRFLALGDGSERLRVAFADVDPPLVEGDLAWAIDPPAPKAGAIERIVEGALLGRLVKGDGPPGADRADWRVEPLSPLATLAEVAVRLPAGFLAPAEIELAPLAVAGRGGAVLGPARDALLLLAGRESGVSAGAAVSRAGRLVGRIERAGWRVALARTLSDPGFRCRVLVLAGEELSACDLEVRAALADGALELAAPPPVDDWNDALVVTAAGAEGVPEGLLLGTLEKREQRCVLLRGDANVADAASVPRDAPPPGEWIVHRPPGPWSAGE